MSCIILPFIQREIDVTDKTDGFIDFFKDVPDHRVDRRKLHPVEEILLVAFCGTIAGCDSWDDLELFGKTKLDTLRRYLPFEHGPPSDDTLRRFFRALDPKAFEACFMKWVQSFQLNLKDKVIAIDGKTSRRSFDKDSKAMHMVSAFATELNLILGQIKTAEKSNEITAIPELIELLDIADAIITIDAMGCQKKIVEKITKAGGEYVIGLKGNQGALSDDVRLAFLNKPQNMKFVEEVEYDKGHGRVETRHCTVSDDIQWLREYHPDWKNLNSIIEITSHRELNGKHETEKRYYISSLSADAKKALHATRSHWGIENKLHWVLDMTFNDDQSRVRKGNAPSNMAIIKKTALNLLQIVKKARPRMSLKRMRKLAGWDNDFLDEVLMAKF